MMKALLQGMESIWPRISIATATAAHVGRSATSILGQFNILYLMRADPNKILIVI